MDRYALSGKTAEEHAQHLARHGDCHGPSNVFLLEGAPRDFPVALNGRYLEYPMKMSFTTLAGTGVLALACAMPATAQNSTGGATNGGTTVNDEGGFDLGWLGLLGLLGLVGMKRRHDETARR